MLFCKGLLLGISPRSALQAVGVDGMDTAPGLRQHFSALPVGGALRHSTLLPDLPSMHYPHLSHPAGSAGAPSHDTCLTE